MFRCGEKRYRDIEEETTKRAESSTRFPKKYVPLQVHVKASDRKKQNRIKENKMKKRKQAGRVPCNAKKWKVGAAPCLFGGVRQESGFQEGLRGSLTIEAALSLTLFLFLVLLLAVPMELLDTQRKVQMAVEGKARELSYQAGMFDLDREAASEEEAASALEYQLLQEGICRILSQTVTEAAGKQKIEALDCSATYVSPDGEWIDLRAKYRLRLPFSVFTLESVPFCVRSRKRGWIGREGGYWSRKTGEEESVIFVYVGKASTRYHSSPSCHYLSNEISAVPFETAGSLVNQSGRHYKACHVCGRYSQSGSMVYLFPNGSYYHSRKDCSAVRAYIREVPLEEVRHLGACSYCGGKRNEKRIGTE